MLHVKQINTKEELMEKILNQDTKNEIFILTFADVNGRNSSHNIEPVMQQQLAHIMNIINGLCSGKVIVEVTE